MVKNKKCDGKIPHRTLKKYFTNLFAYCNLANTLEILFIASTKFSSDVA